MREPTGQALPDVLWLEAEGFADVHEGKWPGRIVREDPVARLGETMAASQRVTLERRHGILENRQREPLLRHEAARAGVRAAQVGRQKGCRSPVAPSLDHRPGRGGGRRATAAFDEVAPPPEYASGEGTTRRQAYAAITVTVSA